MNNMQQPQEVVPDVYETDMEKIVGNWNTALLRVLEHRFAAAGKSLPDVPTEELVAQAPELLEDVTSSQLESANDQFGFIVLTGASGSGKGTIGSLLEKQGIGKFPRITTRPMRPGEQDGVDYHFISDSEFNQRRDSGDFVQHVWNRGVGRGISSSDLEERIKTGQPFYIDAGAETAVNFTPRAQAAGFKPALIFLLTPSFEELYTRLMGRIEEQQQDKSGTVEDAAEINKRLNIAPVLLDRTADTVNTYLVNDAPDRVANKIVKHF